MLLSFDNINRKIEHMNVILTSSHMEYGQSIPLRFKQCRSALYKHFNYCHMLPRGSP